MQLKALTTISVLLFALVTLLSSPAFADHSTPEVSDGDRQLLMSFNAAFHELVMSGAYEQILVKWGLPATSRYNQCSPDDDVKNQWPVTPVGNLKTILENTKTIAFGHANAVNEPFWNGNSGLEDDLAKQITARIAAHFNVSDLTMRWMNPLIDNSGFFNSLYKNLDALGSDIILGAVTITDERAKLVDFTCPYLYVYEGILRGGLEPERDLSTIEKLNAPGVKVAVIPGTVQAQFAATNLTKATIFFSDDIGSGNNRMLDMVANGEVHVALADEISLNSALDNAPSGFCSNCTVYTYGSGSPYGAFLRKPSEDGHSDSMASSIAAISSSTMVLAAALLLLIALLL